MPLTTARKYFWYGLASYAYTPSTYCQNSTSASDYGKCYNIIRNKAVFVQTDTTTYPTLPCETDGTCIRYTSTDYGRYLPIDPNNPSSGSTIFSYPGKQAVLQSFWSRSHTNLPMLENILYLRGLAVPILGNVDPAYIWLFPAVNYEVSSWPVYDPVSNWKAYVNPYTIPVGYVNVVRWQGNVFMSSATLAVYEGNYNNIWYAFDMLVIWAYESSPLAVIPLDYDKEWLPYQELRGAFGYAATGVDQPGWNADDIIRVLRELFPDRAWAVFDDRQYVLYLYNLTPDYVPDWLIEKLAPTAMKVIQSPADAAVAKAWLDLLNERNAQIPPQAELP
jgi:hypothetical protein